MAESVSVGPGDALRLKAEHDRRLQAIDEFIASYEAEYGEITNEEMDAAYYAMKSRAIVVRGAKQDNTR
jgi:hypothetical protein